MTTQYLLAAAPAAPFVLLDDARVAGADARLFRDPVDMVRADDVGDVVSLIEAVEAAAARWMHS